LQDSSREFSAPSSAKRKKSKILAEKQPLKDDETTKMSELGSLFLVVLLVYLLQCVHWVSPGSTVFALNCRGGGKRNRHGFVWSAFGTSGFLAWPLPPLTPIAVVTWPLFEPAPEGLWLGGQDHHWNSRSWSSLTITGTDSKVLCDGISAFKGSEWQTARYAGLLQHVRRARESERGPILLGWLRQAMSTRRAARRVVAFARRSRWLRILANLQLALLFVALPLSFIKFGPAVLWRVAVSLLVISAAITLEFWMVHKKLFPGAGSTRFRAALTILLSPIAAIRAADIVARDLLAEYHPLAVAAAILPLEGFRQFAGEQFRLNRFGDHPVKWYQENLGKLMERVIREKGIKPAELLRPARRDSGSVAYCPRCLAQYVTRRSACSDCGFEGIVGFERSTRSTAS
jgi:hypothetical protein